MPVFGIIIYMNWRDHHPPYLHAVYGEQEALVSVDGTVLAGNLPKRALSMVFEWLAMHRAELLDNWQRAQNRQPTHEIGPLE